MGHFLSCGTAFGMNCQHTTTLSAGFGENIFGDCESWSCFQLGCNVLQDEKRVQGASIPYLLGMMGEQNHRVKIFFWLIWFNGENWTKPQQQH